jgi:hypothetical protein
MSRKDAIRKAQATLDAHDIIPCNRYTPGHAGSSGRCGLPVGHDGPCREVDEADGWDVLRDLLREIGGTR